MASDLLQIGASGMRAHQAAMGVVSENVANASTAGYTRRTLHITESPIASSTMLLYGSTAQYGGVDVGSITRSSDAYLDIAARQAATLKGSADQRTEWLSELQTALNDNTLGVGQRLSSLFSNVEKLAANPTDTTLRMNVLDSFGQVNDAFRQTSTDLKTVRSGIGAEATNGAASLNIALAQLADANKGLTGAQEGTAASAQLLDQRDLALSTIAAHMETTVTFGTNGIARVTYDGQDLVNGNVASTVGVTQNADGTLAFDVNGTGVAAPQSGEMGGLVKSGEVVRDRIASLDAIAAQYVSDINNWHMAGQTAAGAAGAPMLSMTGDAGTLQLLVTAPADIAAGVAGGAINGNLVNISSIRGSGSIEKQWTGLISGHANMLASAKQEQSALTTRYQIAEQARADLSGVNLDREAAELMRLQQAYQASARIIQVARELTQTIFDIF